MTVVLNKIAMILITLEECLLSVDNDPYLGSRSLVTHIYIDIDNSSFTISPTLGKLLINMKTLLLHFFENSREN